MEDSISSITGLLSVIALLLSAIGILFGMLLVQIRNDLKAHVENDRIMFLEFTTRITRLEGQ